MTIEIESLPAGAVGIDTRSLRMGPAGIATCVRNLLEFAPSLARLDRAFPSNNFVWNQLWPPLAQLRRGWKVYHAPSYTSPLVNFSRLVLTVADVSYLAHSEWYPYRIDGFRRRYYRASLFRADRIIVPSDFTRRELLRLYPGLSERIRRIYLGVSPRFHRRPELARQVKTEFDLPARFILHVGDIHPRRNLEQLSRAARQLDMPLVLVGKILRGGESLADHRFLFTNVTLDRLIGFYSAASVLAYPSSYEGFGLPLVEAMACGLPVVASNLSCLPEVCGEAAILVSPDAESLAHGIEDALRRSEDLTRRGLVRAAEFSWEKTARETIAVYRELLT